jgi:hypothetical protein
MAVASKSNQKNGIPLHRTDPGEKTVAIMKK